MNDPDFSEEQRAIIESSLNSRIFLQGPGGTGKSTAAIYRALYLSRKEKKNILIILPQLTLSGQYKEIFRQYNIGNIKISTLSGLARKMIELFWPEISYKAGFRNPSIEPLFLSLETAQYYMSRIIKPLLKKGYFQTLKIKKNHLYTQILNNLNKAASAGFSYKEIGERLKESWIGEKGQVKIYEEAAECSKLFRNYCLENNLIDFSLNIEIFLKYLWPLPLCREYLIDRYKHIIVDNIEEDIPAAHDILEEWLTYTDSALFIYDNTGGYRRFLGADPVRGLTLKNLFSKSFSFTDSFVTSLPLRAFGYEISKVLKFPGEKEEGDFKKAIIYKSDIRYHTQMLDWVVENISELVNTKKAVAGEIVILAPFLSDSLLFSLTGRLKEKNIPFRSHRPSRPLKAEPAVRALLTLAALAHPSWEIIPSRFEVIYGLMQSINNLDLIRATLLGLNLYSSRNNQPLLNSFDNIHLTLQERITSAAGEHYENLYRWINDYIKEPSTGLDHFFNRLFGEILSQEGYGFNKKLDTGEVITTLIASIRKFYSTIKLPDNKFSGKEYLNMVREELAADQYVRRWTFEGESSVFIAPAHTFLLGNRPVKYQFWLNIGARGWWERIYQPVTHAYVLSRQWNRKQSWTDIHEFQVKKEALHRLVLGLIRRCSCKIYLAMSQFGEEGYEEDGRLLKIIREVFRSSSSEVNYV